MDVLTNDSHHLFLLPVALMYQNESGVDEVESSWRGLGGSGTNHSWKKEDVVMGGLPRMEKIGESIRRELKWAFILHTYGFGCLFFILAFYTFFSVLNIRSFISSRPFMSTINGFLCLLGTSRAASLFIDPYNFKENMPKIIGQVLWDVGFPSIISAFCLVQLAFLQLTQLQVGPEGLRRKSCLSLIVTAHFLLTIGIDIVVASHENLRIVKHVIHYIFLTWGVFLCSNFLYTGYKVMSMIRSMPGGLKHRDFPDPSYKGIMQLAILAPHNNLAGSMTAALLPTLCTPKIHQQDNTSLSAVGFRNEGNSRILESESIPMLEEMTGSSGDEISPKALVRGSSFQNQTRNSQKYNLKPRLSLKSISDDAKDEDTCRGKHLGPRSPKSSTPKTQSPKLSSKGNEFDFGTKPGAGILKNTESFVTTRNISEFKSKIQRTSFENENFRFPGERKSKGGNPGGEDSVPDIFVSGPSGLKDGREVKTGEEKNRRSLNKLMNEISKDLDEMQIVREDRGGGKLEEVVEIHETKRDKSLPLAGNLKSKGELDRGFVDNKRGEGRSQIGDRGHRNSCRKDCYCSAQEATTSKREGISSALSEIVKFEESKAVKAEKIRGRRKGKSLSWKKKQEDEEEDNATKECLLSQENQTDVSLRSVLNHIAYINRGAPTNVNGEDDLEKVRKSKVEWVLNITYITAMWGLMLCLSNMGKIYNPFGVPGPRKATPSSNSTYFQEVATEEGTENGILFSSWPWLWFQTFCRALELAMGCAMANITRQPTANHRYPRTLSLRHRDTFYSI